MQTAVKAATELNASTIYRHKREQMALTSMLQACGLANTHRAVLGLGHSTDKSLETTQPISAPFTCTAWRLKERQTQTGSGLIGYSYHMQAGG